MIIGRLALLPSSRSLVNIAPLSATLQKANLHLSQPLNDKRAGRYRCTVKRDNPLTYEMANKPDMIGVRKSWNSFNTSAHVVDGIRSAECAQEDILIRKFLHGTWPNLLASDVIIKRRANLIVLTLLVLTPADTNRYYWLLGYTEEILSYILKSVVKIELQSIVNKTDLIYKYI